MINILSVKNNIDANSIFRGYIVTDQNNIVWFVPNDTSNSDYQSVQDWIQQGNTIAS